MSNFDIEKPKIAIVIPARIDGTRLPGKVLMEFYGIPMVEHVRRRAKLNKHSVDVFVATGDEEVATMVQRHGGKILKTYNQHENGTSRCAEASQQLDCDFVLIVQGDELLILPRHIDLLIERINQNKEIVFFNAVAPLTKHNELNDASVVKCAIDKNEKIIFMFRKSPVTKEADTHLNSQWKVLGLFAIKKELLQHLNTLSNTPFYLSESIEQLKLIENGIEVTSVLQDISYPSLNTSRDIQEIYRNIEESVEQQNILQSTLINA